MLLLILACSKSDSVSDSGVGADTDEECTSTLWYPDLDHDGYGRQVEGTEACVAPYDNVDNDLDCDDTDPNRNPDAVEITGDGEDTDCDGFEDCFEDLDGDGYGSSEIVLSEDYDCADPGEADDELDCDDTHAAVNPDGIEDCNGADDDCDGTIDEDAGEIGTFFADNDGDGFGDPDNAMRGCSQPSGTVEDQTDCDDSDASVNPDGVEVCNGVDDDCDESTSEDGMVALDDGTDLTADWTGSGANPSLETDGTVWICDGTYTVNVDISADVTLASLSGDATAVVLDGESDGSVVTIGGGLDVDLEDLTIQDGAGSVGLFSDTSGGGVVCIGGADGSDLTLSGVVLQDNEAVLGGAYASYRCDTTFVDVELSDNYAETLGGAGLILDGVHDWSSVLVSDNRSGYDVGGVHFYGYVDGIEATLDEVFFSANDADNLVGAVALTGATVEWTGTSSTESGVHDNADDSVDGGVYLQDAEVRFDVVDFGEDGDDNELADVYLQDGSNGWSYETGDDASFTCDADGCGTEVDYDLGGSDEETSAVDMAVLDVILADTDATVDHIGIYAQVDTGCQLDFYLLEGTGSIADGATSWTMLWGNSESGDATGAGAGWNTSDDMGIVVKSGTYYAVGVGFLNCSTAEVDISSSPATDGGFGTSTGSAVEDSYTTVLSSSSSNSLEYDSSTAGPYRIRVGVTEL